jgi:hypothetical protein
LAAFAHRGQAAAEEVFPPFESGGEVFVDVGVGFDDLGGQ